MKANPAFGTAVRFAVIHVLSIFALIPVIKCSYAVDVARYATEERYISGKEAKSLLTTSVMSGYAIYLQTHPSADPIPPALGLFSTRVKENREYLKSTIDECSNNLLLTSATGQNSMNMMLTGLICDLGPGKSADEY